MPVIGMHITHWVDLAIAIAWAMAGTIYYLSTRWNSKPVRAILRPLRLFGMGLSLTWAGFYILTFVGVLHVDRTDAVHQVTDGLILTTAIFLMAVSTTASRMLRQLGVE